MPNSRKYFFSRYPEIGVSGLTQKFKIWLPNFSGSGPEFYKKAHHTPVVQKLREEIDFLEICYFWHRVMFNNLVDLKPYPKIFSTKLD
jgi:hypothetical protein